nr:MAG TPA: hypothetical protein [Caudoviricetes sp.]
MKTTVVGFSLYNDSSCLYKDSPLIYDRISSLKKNPANRLTFT